MRKTKLLKPTGQDQIERIFSGLEQTVERGTSVIFSFPEPGCIVAFCAASPVQDFQSASSKRNTAIALNAGLETRGLPDAMQQIRD